MTFDEWFEKSFQHACPIRLSPNATNRYAENLWTTNFELVTSLNFPLKRNCFADDDADDFEAFTYWGHGVNSYAMCYFSKFGERQLHLQLGYGGVYMSPESNQASLDTLGEIMDWKERSHGLVIKEKTLCVFGEWEFSLTFADSSSLNLAGTPPWMSHTVTEALKRAGYLGSE